MVKYKGLSCFNLAVRPPLHPQIYLKSNYKLDQETRNSLQYKEQYRFCITQLGWFTITVMLTASFELLIFVLGFFGSDFDYPKGGSTV